MTDPAHVEIQCTAHNHEPPFERTQEGAGSIHDNDIALEQGFTGALVPGIVTTAYSMPLLLKRWGEDWIKRGTISARFRRPVYDDDNIAISYGFESSDEGERATIEVLREGEPAVVGEAFLASGPATFDLDHLKGEALPAPAEPVYIEPGKFQIGQELYSEPLTLTADILKALNQHIDLQPGDWPEGRVHPFVYLLLAAMHQQVGTKFTSPGIHYAAQLRMIEPAQPGDTLETVGKIVDIYERNGHHYFNAEQLIRTTQGQNVALSHNTVIYKTRSASEAS